MTNLKSSLTFLTFLCMVFFISMNISILAQENSEGEKEIDPSKPTNLYTQVNLLVEYKTTADGNSLYGTRFNIQYTFNPDNLIFVEVPLLYNNNGKRFGLFDIRVRYFTVVERNISPNFIAIAPFIDLSLPTGSFENGLGTSTTSIGIGTVFGIALSKSIAFFPGISYVHVTKEGTDLILDSLKFSGNGIGFQVNASISFSSRVFLFVNPILLMLYSNDEWNDIWSGEFSLNYLVTPNKLKINVAYAPNFTPESHTIRVGATLYL